MLRAILLFPLLLHAQQGTNLSVLVEDGDAAVAEGMVDLARDRFTAIFQSKDASELRKLEALLKLSRIALQQGDAAAAGALLDEHLPLLPPKPIRTEASLLRADVLLANGRVMRAMSQLDLLQDQELAVAEKLLLARLRARGLRESDRADEALGIYEGIETNLAPDQLVGIRLDWSGLLQEQGELLQASNLLEAAALAPLTHPDAQQARLRLVAMDLNQGNASNALLRLNVFLEDGELRDSLKAAAQALQADALEQLGRVEDALNALKGLEAHSIGATELAKLRVRQAALWIQQGQLSNATVMLRTQIAVLGDDVLAAGVQEQLAEARLSVGDFEGAGTAFQEWLDVFSDQKARLRVELGKAWSLENLGEWEAAAHMYEKVATAGEADARVKGDALLKWSDMDFRGGEYTDARTRYQLFLKEFPADDRIARAAFQAAVCLARLEKPAAAVLGELDKVRWNHPGTEFAERALLEKAGVMNRALRLEQALGLYDAYLEQYPEGEFVCDALMDKGMASYRLGLYDLALRLFDRVQQEFPETERAEQAFFMRGWAMYMRGKEQKALSINRAFLQKFPESRWAPDVRFWVAEHAFNNGSYQEAEDDFVALAKAVTDPEAQAQAFDLGGRAALARKDQGRAVELLTAAIDIAPESGKVADRLFYKGDALTELNRFDVAIVVFDSLIERFPNSWLVHAAWGRKGDCQFTLGESDEKRFAEALASYRTVAESAKADPGLALQAAYKMGRTLSSMEQEDEALVQYQEAVLQYLSKRELLGADAEAWFVRAATDAAQVFEKRGNWREALRMYEKLVDAGVPQAAEAQKRIFRLRRDHFFLF